MSSSINPVGKNVNITAINRLPKANKPNEEAGSCGFYGNVTELSPVTNDSMVKAPMAYTKTGEIQLPFDMKAQCYKFANGQRVVIIPKDGETVLKTYVNTGSMNETDNIRGISHYIEHNLFNGSDGLEAGEFFKTTDRMGAETNASTGMAETNYFISSHLLNDDDLENKIKIHASMLESPRFAVDMLEKEKGIVNSEINMITSEPSNIAYYNTLKNLFNIKTSSNDVIAGTTDNITNLTREDVVEYYNNNYYPANMVTVVTGEVNPEETMKLLSKYFSSTKTSPKTRYCEELKPLNETKRQDLISDKAKSTFITMGFVGPANNDAKDRICVEALDRLMFKSSKAKNVFSKLNTSVDCVGEKISTRQSDSRALMLVADVGEANSEKLLKAIYSRIGKYQNNLPTAEEMSILKRDMKSDFARMFEYSAAINSGVGEAMLEDCMDSVVNFEKIVDELTPQDITNAARKYFDLKRTAITVLHPAGVDENSINSNYNAAKSVTFTGALKKHAVNLDNVKQYNAPNNIRIGINDINLPTSTLMFDYDTGSPVKVENPAAYAVLGQLLDEGSASMNFEELTRYKEQNGIKLAVFASTNGIEAFSRTDAPTTGKALDLIKSIIENPRFDEETFNKAKNDVLDKINRAEKSPWNKLKAEVFKDECFLKEDVKKGLETLTLDDVKNLHAKIMENAHASAAISAPVGENPNLKSQIFNKISSFNSVKPFKYEKYDNFEPQTESKVFTEIANKNQAKIVMAYKFKDVGNLKDNVTVELLNTILGGGPSSRLFNDLREQQKLAYSVRSVLENRGSTSTINLTIGTTTDNKETGERSFDNLQKSINGFKFHVDKMKNEKVSEEELNSAKLSLKNSILSACESIDGKNNMLINGLNSYYGLGRENQYLEMIDSITVDDIYNAAQNIFGGKPLYSIVATEATIDYNKDYLSKL